MDSVFEQTYTNLQVVVVDDGSTDGSREIISSYSDSRLEYRFQPASGGPSAPRNTALSICRGEYVAFFDADDIMSADKIQWQLDFMLDNPSLGLSFMDYFNFDEGGKVSNVSHFESCDQLLSISNDGEAIIPSGKACMYLLRENFACCGSMMIRRDVLDVVAEFDESLKACVDFDFYYRAARFFDVGALKKISFMRRIHSNNITVDKLRMLTNYILSRTKILLVEKDPENIEILRLRLVALYVSRSREYALQGNAGLSYRDCWQVIVAFPGLALGRTKSIVKIMIRNLLVLLKIS